MRNGEVERCVSGTRFTTRGNSISCTSTSCGITLKPLDFTSVSLISTHYMPRKKGFDKTTARLRVVSISRRRQNLSSLSLLKTDRDHGQTLSVKRFCQQRSNPWWCYARVSSLDHMTPAYCLRCTQKHAVQSQEDTVATTVWLLGWLGYIVMLALMAWAFVVRPLRQVGVVG